MALKQILSRIWDSEYRGSIQDPDPALVAAFGGADTSAGIPMNEVFALNLSAVYAAVSIISETVGTIPLLTYERGEGNARERALDFPLYDLLAVNPNPEMTPVRIKETLMAHTLLWGNGYWEIVKHRRTGEILELWPMLPDRTRPVREGGVLWYMFDNVSGPPTRLRPDQVFHIAGLGWDGLRGYSTVSRMRDTLAISKASEDFGGTFYKNNGMISGVIETPGRFAKVTDKQEFREQFEAVHSPSQGGEPARIAVLDGGMKYHSISVPPDDAQFLETRLFQVREVARMFRLPPHKLGDLADATFSNIEQQNREFIDNTIRPWVKKIEEEAQRKLLLPAQRRFFFVEFHMVDLLRGDSQARGEFYRTLRQNGIMSANEIRAAENMNPIPAEEGGDAYTIQLNMQNLSGLLAEQLEPGDDDENSPPDDDGVEASPQNDDDTPPDSPRSLELTPGFKWQDGGNYLNKRNAADRIEYEARSIKARMNTANSHRGLFQGVSERIVKREGERLKKLIRRYIETDNQDFETFNEEVRDFFTEFGEWQVRQWLPVLNVYVRAVALEADRDLADVDAEEFEPIPDETVEKFARGLAEAMAIRHNVSSQGQVDKILGEVPPDQVGEALATRVNEWQETRPEKMTRREITQSLGAVSVMVYGARGVRRLIWRTIGESCPICREVNGRTVETGRSFFNAGDSVTPTDDSVERLVVKRSMSHPPLHQGCDCVVIPG